MTKLASSLPKSLDDDGLASINRRLIENPDQQHLVVALVDCKKIETLVDDGAVVATARVVRIEPISDTDDQNAAADILQRAADKRQGRQPIPGVDLATGEVRKP